MALPPAMDLSAYRILQEAVTNILKHARAHRAEIRVSYSPTTLALFVRDDGVSSSRPSMPPGGHGLIGMRERVALFGGELRAGPRPGGGFEVWASIPLTGA
jgi:signal transduction histidine kinase